MKLNLAYKNGQNTSYSLEGYSKEEANNLINRLQLAITDGLVIRLDLGKFKLLINTFELIQVTLIE